MKCLTPSMQHYIKALFVLSSDNEGVHIREIAEKLGVTKASVSIAMKVLQKDDFVYRGRNRLVFLTEKGENQALCLTEKYKIIKCFLIEVLQLDSEIAAQDACAIEHVISTETLCSICRYPNRKCTVGCFAKTDTVPQKIKSF